MIKTLTTTLMLAVASCSFSPAYAQTSDVCQMTSTVAGLTSLLRNSGVPAGQALTILMTFGVPEDQAYDMLLEIYTNLKDVDGVGVANQFYSTCISSEV